MTNFERIKQMNIDDMAADENIVTCPYVEEGCQYPGTHTNINESVATCRACIKEWLGSEAK